MEPSFCSVCGASLKKKQRQQRVKKQGVVSLSPAAIGEFFASRVVRAERWQKRKG